MAVILDSGLAPAARPGMTEGPKWPFGGLFAPFLLQARDSKAAGTRLSLPN
jgi:hypothetical protein